MKKCLFIICALLLTAGCSNFGVDKPEILQTEDETESEISIIPSHSLSDKEYKIILPYRMSAARGAIKGQFAGNRLDINEMEEGLRRHSTGVFDPEKYFFEEGQFLTTKYIFSLIDELNPQFDGEGEKDELIEEQRDNPRIFSHILEQNFLQKTKDDSVEVVGISIGIAVRSEYRFQVETGGAYYYEKIPDDVGLAEGQRIANIVFNNIRDIEGLQDMPIMLAIFQQEVESSVVSGDFLAKTFVAADEVAIGKWETINEEHVLFPSEYASKNYGDDNQKVRKFSSEIAEFFPNYVGVIGEGFYVDESLKRLSLEIPIEFYGQGEVIGFTQYTYGLVQRLFSNDYDLEIKVTSGKETESVIYRSAGEADLQVHLFN